MVFLISLLLIAQGSTKSNPLWATSDTLIEDSLGSYVDFAADYNYSNGNIYVACIPDSGTYFGPDSMGILLLRSTDHGATWNMIFRDAYLAQYWETKEIDLVVTRDDTVYVLMSWYHDVFGYDQMNIAKIWGEVGMWNIDWLLADAIEATEIRSPKLVKDDFDDFYLYMVYFNITSGYDTLYVLRSTDRGYNWGTMVLSGTIANLQDVDIEVADSTLYYLSAFQYGPSQTLQFGHWRSRMDVGYVMHNILSVNTTIYEPVLYPRIGATTTLPDTTQLVYAFFSQEKPGGTHDLLYLYSEDGGNNWFDSIPDTLAQGSYSPVVSDIRGYQSSPNQYMNVTYCLTAMLPTFTNYYRWSSASNPTNWHDTTTVGSGMHGSVPELVYSPGSPAPGGGVVYNDASGNLWFDAPWIPSGITENLNENIDKIMSKIVLAGSSVEAGSPGAVVYDVTGREIIKLNTNTWDLKDGKGKEVKTGIYFIVNKENGNKIKLSILK